MSDPSAPRTVVIVGGVAGGASAAARLRRLDDTARIIVFERSGYVSFANCGLPYHLSDTIADRDALLLQTPDSLHDRFGLDVRVRHEVTAIDRESRVVRVSDLATGEEFDQPYDALVLSPGATPVIPPIEGADLGFPLRDVEDLDRIVAAAAGARSAVVVGAGFIGLETAENLREAGLDVTVVELAHQVLAPLDPEMAQPVAEELRHHGIDLRLGRSVTAIRKGEVVLDDATTIAADVTLIGIGVRPDTLLARMAGLELGPHGGIAVDSTLRTSDPHIWAVGDAVEKTDILDGAATLVPLANIANRQGRRAADAIMGRSMQVRPAQGTAIVKIFRLAAAATGWNEKALARAGRSYRAIHTHTTDHASYYPGSHDLSMKLLYDPVDGEILGAQAVGSGGVDKRIDVLATAMRTGLTAPDLIDLELAYAPPFGSAKDPINQLGYIAENRLAGQSPSVDWSEVDELQQAGWEVLDVRDAQETRRGMIPGALTIPLDELRDRSDELPAAQLIVCCAGGQRSHVAVSMLRGRGVEAVNLDGGYRTWAAARACRDAVVPV